MNNLYADGKLVIGIDHGYGNMKTRNVVFKSGVKSYSEEPAIATNVLQLDGMYYVIGEIRMRTMITISSRWQQLQKSLRSEA